MHDFPLGRPPNRRSRRPFNHFTADGEYDPIPDPEEMPPGIFWVVDHQINNLLFR